MQGVLKKCPKGRFFIEFSPTSRTELIHGQILEVSYLGYWVEARVEFSLEIKAYRLVIDSIGMHDFGVGLSARLPDFNVINK